MKKNAVIFLSFIAVPALWFGSCTGDPWSRQGYADYTIEFPGKASDTATIEDNMYTTRLFYEPVSAIDPNAYYEISVCNAPAIMLDTIVKLEDALTADVKVYALFIDGKLKGKAVPVKAGTVDGFEFKVEMERAAGEVTLRKFIHNKKMYTLRVITPADHLGNESVKRFLNSLELK